MIFLKGNCFIPAPHGKLEAIFREDAGSATKVALILHPHPLHGGTMHNKVVYRAAKALQNCGYEPLRFNFRGVGQSTGSYGEGIAEREDARVALDFLLERHPLVTETIVAGFSFGSIVGLNVGCSDPRVDRIIAIGVPARFGSLEILSDCAKPKLFLHGEADDIAPLAPLREFLDSLPAGKQNHLVTIPDANHFFDQHGEQLIDSIEDFVGQSG